MGRRLLALIALLLLVALARTASSQEAPAPSVHVALVQPPPAALAVPLDPQAAMRAYLDTVPPDVRARSDAYFVGGYWIQLWQFLYGSAIGLALLHLGVSARMRDVASRVTKVRFVHTALYWLVYLVVTSFVSFPLALYTDYFREHAYGLSTMTFGAWMGDQTKGLVIAAILGGLFVPVLYAILARARRTWWIWGAGAVLAFMAFVSMVAPVYLAPVFNKYTPLTDEAVRAPILSMARANGIGVTDVYEFDASRQSNRVSANVSGLSGTERISLNDNLLSRCSIEEIEAVMGHEMGHYVLNHVPKFLYFAGGIILVGFALVRWSFERLRARFASRWKVTGIEDPAGLPLFALLFGAYLFLLTPVLNTLIRTQESEADIFGLNAARQPDGMAQVTLKLAEYRKLDPGPIEEWMLFDHPSGRARILMAMKWKAEHPSSTAQRGP
jgi:STE24 endopeptidase